MGKYGDLLKKCDDKRKTIEEAKEERKRQEKIAKSAKLTKGMRALATLLKDVENIDDIFIRYNNRCNYIKITFETNIDIVESFTNIFDTHFSIYNYAKVKPGYVDMHYYSPYLTINNECISDLNFKCISICLENCLEMNIDDAMEVVIKRLEDGYIE